MLILISILVAMVLLFYYELSKFDFRKSLVSLIVDFRGIASAI